jgi:hypothetical protein
MGFVPPSPEIDRELVLPDAPPLLDPITKTEVPPFIHFPGSLSGRVKKADGTYSFVLGDISGLRVEEFATDDYIEVWQDVDVTKIEKIETRADTPSVESSVDWALQLRVGAIIFAEKDLPRRVEASHLYLIAPIAREAGVKRVAVRLIRR